MQFKRSPFADLPLYMQNVASLPSFLLLQKKTTVIFHAKQTKVDNLLLRLKATTRFMKLSLVKVFRSVQ